MYREGVAKKTNKFSPTPSPTSPPPTTMKLPEKFPSSLKTERLHNQQDDPTSVDMETPLKKKKQKHRREYKDVSLASSPATDGDMSIKKKKKRKEKPEQGEEHQDIDTDSVLSIDTSIRKKKKKIEQKQDVEEVQASGGESLAESQDGETDPVMSGETNIGRKKKKKKKRKQEQEEDEVQGSEGEPLTGSQDEETDPVMSDETNIRKKKKKKRKQEQEEEEVQGSEGEPLTGSQDEETDPVMSAETNIRKKKKRKHEEEQMHVAEGDHVTEIKKKAKKQKKMLSEEESDFNEAIITTGSTIATINQHHQNITGTESESLTDREVQTITKHEMEEDEREQDGLLEEGQTVENVEDPDGGSNSALLVELGEYIPNIRTRSKMCLQEMIKYDLPRYREFKKKGVSVRWGRFSEEENQQLRNNITDFLALIGIKSVSKVLFPQRHKDVEMEIKKLKAHHCFMSKISEGIPRPCRQVVIRAKKMFDKGNHMGRFSEEELKTLIKLQNRHGNDWKTISEKMGRSSFSLEKRFVSLSENHGSWSQKEESLLKNAMHDHLKALVQQNPEGSGLSREQLCHNLPWTEISHKVQTRHWVQCRLKWFSLLKSKLGSGVSTFNRKSEGQQAKIQLINTLFNMGVDDIADIDWDEVAKTIGNVTPVCVQKTFQRLKCSKVPNRNNLSFGEIVDFLHTVVVPDLKETVEESLQEGEQQGEEQEKKMYQLSEIFSSEGEEELEVDNTQQTPGQKKKKELRS